MKFPMPDLDPCLRGCDSALAEADLLIAMLSAAPGSLQPEMLRVRTRIALLRHEVDRLRGVPILPPWKHSLAQRSELDGEDLPWPQRGPANDG